MFEIFCSCFEIHVLIDKSTEAIYFFHTMTVFEFPPNESCNKRVNFEFLYGMWVLFPSTKALITFPSTDSDRLILVASFNRIPVAWVLLWRSEPYKRKILQSLRKKHKELLLLNVHNDVVHTAKSTSCNLPIFTCSAPLSSVSLLSTVIEKIACERDDSTFILVAPVARFLLPSFIILSRSSALFTT